MLLLLTACDAPLQPAAEVQTREQRAPITGRMSAAEIKENRITLGNRLQTEPDPAVRMEIAAALAYTARDRESIPALARALKVERDVNVQRRLIATLASFSDPSSVSAIVDFWLAGVDPGLEADVLGALGGADPSMVRAVLDARPEADPRRVAQARSALP